MHSACTSEEMVSGLKPWASIVRAVFQPNDPLPWPMSNSTPRCRAASTSGLIWPSRVTGEFGKGRKQWVSTSPGRSRSTTAS